MLTTAIGLLLGRSRTNETKLHKLVTSFWVSEPNSYLGSATVIQNGSSWKTNNVRMLFYDIGIVNKTVLSTSETSFLLVCKIITGYCKK